MYSRREDHGNKQRTRVFFVAEDRAQADSMAKYYAPCFTLYPKRPISFIPPGILQKYLLEEGEYPMRESKHAQYACGQEWQE
jgi:hypothetical protein